MRLATSAALLLAAAVLAGCGEKDEPPVVAPEPQQPGDVACTEIGCSSGLSLDLSAIPGQLPRAERLRVCVGERCAGYPASIGFIELRDPGLREGQQVQVTLRVISGQGRTIHSTETIATVIRVQPNGPECPPTCFQVPVQLRPRTLRLVPTGSAVTPSEPEGGSQPGEGSSPVQPG